MGQQVLGLRLPHDRHVVKFGDVVEQGVDDGVAAALSEPSDKNHFIEDDSPLERRNAVLNPRE